MKKHHEESLQLSCSGRSQAVYSRDYFRGDVLHAHFIYRQVHVVFPKNADTPARITDLYTEQMMQSGVITPAQKEHCDRLIAASFSAQSDQLGAPELYQHIHALRTQTLGLSAVRQQQNIEAARGLSWDLQGCIDQSAQKAALLDACNTVIFALNEAAFLHQMQEDIQAACKLGKRVFLLCSEEGLYELPAQRQLQAWLKDTDDMQFLHCSDEGIYGENSLQTAVQCGEVCLFAYGEEGLLQCRSLCLDAIVTALPRGYAARALVNQLDCERPCVVYVPRQTDITPYVPLIAQTRLSYWHLWRLCADHGMGIYRCTADELYARYPQYFINMYQNGASCPESSDIWPLRIAAGEIKDKPFEQLRDEAIQRFWEQFDNIEYRSAYFDEHLQPAPVCYQPQEQQKGILLHTVRIKKARNSRIISLEKGVPLRKSLSSLDTGIVSNFLFFMTPKLAALYNELRADRPHEQADVSSGHLDYMLCHRDGQRIETFPLFRKTCIALKADGEYLFFNFRLGGGSIRVGDLSLRWEKSDVDTPADHAPIRVYTPYYSLPDGGAEQFTYRKIIGEDRVNIVILQDRICCIRRGDVVLPSVGVVVSLNEMSAKSLLSGLKPLDNGYFDVSGTALSVHLDAPAGVNPADWETVQWAYGGGLSLILEGKGLCDDDHTAQWFEDEGWMSPLSCQTQESALHTMARHPRTAIGVTYAGDMVILVFSGRTKRSVGADYNEMCRIARHLYPDIRCLMNADGGGSAMLGLICNGQFMELSCPSTSSDSCVGMSRPIKTVFYIAAEKH